MFFIMKTTKIVSAWLGNLCTGVQIQLLYFSYFNRVRENMQQNNGFCGLLSYNAISSTFFLQHLKSLF